MVSHGGQGEVQQRKQTASGCRVGILRQQQNEQGRLFFLDFVSLFCPHF